MKTYTIMLERSGCYDQCYVVTGFRALKKFALKHAARIVGVKKEEFEELKKVRSDNKLSDVLYKLMDKAGYELYFYEAIVVK